MYLGHSIIAVGVVVIANTLPAAAQNMSFGALNFDQSSRVSVRSITFKDMYGMSVAANLNNSDAFNRSANAPAIVVGHPLGAVKEQSANLYAQKLAERGFVAISLNHSFWGASQGQPAQRGVTGPVRRSVQRGRRPISARRPLSIESASAPSASAAAGPG